MRGCPFDFCINVALFKACTGTDIKDRNIRNCVSGAINLNSLRKDTNKPYEKGNEYDLSLHIQLSLLHHIPEYHQGAT